MRAAKRGVKVQYFTMEMPASQLMQRVASYITQIDGVKIRDKLLSPQEIDGIENILKGFEESGKIHFVEEPHISLKEVRRNMELFRPDIVFIDHIGLMERPKAKDTYRALGMVSNGLKQLALEKKTPIVELCQLNRQIEGRKDKKPTLADIRESGDIEQDADYVLAVQVEDISEKNLSGDAWADAEIYLLKNGMEGLESSNSDGCRNITHSGRLKRDMDEIENIIRSVPGKWQAYEAVKKALQSKALIWEEYQKGIRYAAERLGI